MTSFKQTKITVRKVFFILFLNEETTASKVIEPKADLEYTRVHLTTLVTCSRYHPSFPTYPLWVLWDQ